jgi:hypothetical protein
MQKNNKNSYYCSVVTVVIYKRRSLEERCEIELRSDVNVSVQTSNTSDIGVPMKDKGHCFTALSTSANSTQICDLFLI